MGIRIILRKKSNILRKVNKMEKFKSIICPVCGKFYFSKPQDEGEEKEYLNGEAYCFKCGWIYDLGQAKNPESKDGFNKMSLNDYKKWYETKLKENPNYDYLEENMPEPSPHKCPVCGEHEFEDIDSHDICPVCGWEDEDYFDGGGANDLSLEEAKKEFAEKRIKNPSYKWIKDK